MNLNCTNTGQVPVSLSLHSVSVRPTEYEPNIAALTVRTGCGEGEVRLVHGWEEINRAIKNAVADTFGGKNEEEEMEEPGYSIVKIGNSLAEIKDKNQFVLSLFSHLTSEKCEVISSLQLTPSLVTDQVAELFTWIVKKSPHMSPSTSCCLISFSGNEVEVVAKDPMVAVNNTLKIVLDNFELKNVKVSESGYISEEDKKNSSNEDLDETGREHTDDIKENNEDIISEPSNAKGINESEKSDENKLNSLGKSDTSLNDQPLTEEVNDNIGKEIPDVTVDIECTEMLTEDNTKEPQDKYNVNESSISVVESTEENLTVLSKENCNDSPSFVNQSRTIPTKEIEAAQNSPKEESPKNNQSQIQKARSMIGSSLGSIRPLSPGVSVDDPSCPSLFTLSKSNIAPEFLIDLVNQLLCRQWKLVTSLTSSCDNQVIFRHDPRILPGLGGHQSGISVDHSGIVRLFNASQEIVENIKLFADLGISEGKRHTFQLKEDTGLPKGRAFLTEVVGLFNNYGFQLSGSLNLAYKTNLLLFRTSNVQMTSVLGLVLGRGNMVTVTGAGTEEMEVIRETLNNRWPYPVIADQAVSGDCWSWKVKRYPWRLSYGNKLLDRAVDRATRMVRQISFPPPNNNDLESAKSVVVFLIKELAEKGWKFVGSNMLSNSDNLLHFTR